MDMKVMEHRLDIQRFASQMILESSFLARCPNTTVEAVLLELGAQHRLSITTKMAGHVVETHEYPTTWIDALKERFQPKWLQTWFPVRRTVVKTWQCYPEYPLPYGGRPIQYFTVDQIDENI